MQLFQNLKKYHSHYKTMLRMEGCPLLCYLVGKFKFAVFENIKTSISSNGPTLIHYSLHYDIEYVLFTPHL